MKRSQSISLYFLCSAPMKSDTDKPEKEPEKVSPLFSDHIFTKELLLLFGLELRQKEIIRN